MDSTILLLIIFADGREKNHFGRKGLRTLPGEHQRFLVREERPKIIRSDLSSAIFRKRI